MPSNAVAAAVQEQRLDQWMWFARLTKSRTLAQAEIERGKVRVNGVKAGRPSQPVKPGDVLTVASGPRVRLITVKGIGTRRGPATEAQALYEELTPVADRTKSSAKTGSFGGDPLIDGLATAVRPTGAGRPTKRERRDTERLKNRFRES
ncbi:MAG: RNA-binding S4 domain-containing protein [Hyphomicrobium sp.]|nr:RNA-binding S4 domain-containing protein [Hyphomicrobium sp.]